MSIDNEWEMVREFHKKFYNPVSDKPVMLTDERAKKRYNWMLEELNEFLEAPNIVEQADAMIDLIYFALGTMVEMGVKPAALFEIVQQANMSKLWHDGLPHYNGEGKIIKSPDWVDPYPKLEKAIDEMKIL